MSPELFDPEKFGLKDGRQTKHSDCYALGMVIYEVLSGRAPFLRYHGYAVVVRILKGERPVRPRGGEGGWFTNDIWSILERCWQSSPGDRPSIKSVLQGLEEVSRSWTPPEKVAGLPARNPPARRSNQSAEESAADSEAPFPSQTISPQPSRMLLLKGAPNESSPSSSVHGTSVLSNCAPGYQGNGAGAVTPSESDSEESVGILDMVSCAGAHNGSWY